MLTLTPESELERLLLDQIAAIKRDHPGWRDPYALARALRIRVEMGQLGEELEGAAFEDRVVLNTNTELVARRYFTLYHEIMHRLIRRNAPLYSTLHDQYPLEEALRKIVERLCDIGAAEFLVPKEVVVAAINARGVSIALVDPLSEALGASRTAVCVQVVLRASHRCIATICRKLPVAGRHQLSMSGPSASRPVALMVDLAINSGSMKYPVARGTLIPLGHLLHEAYQSDHGEIVRGKALIPFRNNRSWTVECEAVRLGTQVFALFHADPPPAATVNQLPLLL